MIAGSAFLAPGSCHVIQPIGVSHKNSERTRMTITQRIRNYTGEKIDVTYDAGRCIHVGECLRCLPTVFDKSKRPWVLPDAGLADSVAATVLTCPSGALHYERKDDNAGEPKQEHNTIRLARNGPLYLRGDFMIVNGAGDLVIDDTRAALCRCGESTNKPFCDNTHRTIAFTAPSTVAEPQTNIEPLDGANYTSKPRPMDRCTLPATLWC